jgi:hypothetical protein
MIDPHVEPASFSASVEGAIVVEVHQIVHDLKGKLLSDKMAGHIFRIEDGLIRRFDIPLSEKRHVLMVSKWPQTAAERVHHRPRRLSRRVDPHGR